MSDESWRAPAIVQELVAAGVEEPPSRYVLRERDRPDTLLVAAEMPEPVPVVDLSRLAGADEAAKLRSALQNWGFFLLTNHGVEASLMDNVMSLTREFFNQPIERKRKLSNLIDGKNFQVEGYGTDRVVTQDQILDWSDRLHLKVEPKEEQDLAFWPDKPESFRDILNKYASRTRRIRDDIIQAMAKLIDLDEDYFINQVINKAPAFGRFNYYPPFPRPELVFGVRPHSDGGLLTILLVDKDVGGLQVQRDGKWYNVQASPHTFLINLGDTMEIICNCIFMSPVHRVVTNAEKERISLAMFYGVNGEKDIEPAAGLLDENRPARYRKVSVREFMAGIFAQFYGGGRYIDSLKI